MRWMALILALPCFGEDCLEFGRPVKLDGQLVLRDDRG